MQHIKIMWASSEFIFWDMKTEMPINFEKLNISDRFYKKLLVWKVWYQAAYKNWLNGKNNDIYDLQNKHIIDLLEEIYLFSEENKLFVLFYWYDVDRDTEVDFVWNLCPMCSQNLIYLEGNHTSNSFICSKNWLVFPK